MTRRPRDRRPVAFAASVVGLFLVVLSAYKLRDSERLVQHGVHAWGRVERIEQRRSARGRRRAVAHVTVDGALPGACVIDADDLSVGQTVEMVFLPDDPSVCRRPTPMALWGGPGVGVGVGTLVFLGSLAYLARERRRLMT